MKKNNCCFLWTNRHLLLTLVEANRHRYVMGLSGQHLTSADAGSAAAAEHVAAVVVAAAVADAVADAVAAAGCCCNAVPVVATGREQCIKN